MRVLVLSPLVPDALGSGGQARMHHLARGLVGRGHRVSVCCPVPGDRADAVRRARAAGLEIFGTERPPSRVVETFAAMRRRPALVTRAVTRPLGSWQLDVLWGAIAHDVARVMAEGVDAVVVEWDLAAAWRSRVPAAVPTVLSTHDISAVYVARRAALTGGLRGAALRVDEVRLRRFTREWVPRYDRVVTVSRSDAESLQQLVPGTSAVVVNNGVDPEVFAQLAPPAVGVPPTVIFTGTLNYPPNTDGAIWLAREVWPTVRDAVRGARLLIVGHKPPRGVRALAAADVEIHADVPDVRPHLARSHVVAVPIRSGGGTRLKVLEAAAAGRPIVSTTIGVEGLDVPDVALADTPASFAAKLVELLGDPALRQERVTRPRATVTSRYAWSALGDQFASIVEDACATPRARR